MPKIAAYIALAIWLSALPAGNCKPLTQYPEFAEADASPVLIVARVRPGKYMSQFSQCDDPRTICMDPPPFWFWATVTSTVYGFVPPRRLQVATTSHYGMSDDYSNDQQLILLKTDGRDFVMPRYASSGLIQDIRGELHLLVVSSHPIGWLPCSVFALRQEISDGDFQSDLEIRKEDFGRYGVEENPNLFRLTKRGSAVPRFAIPVDAMRAHLQSLAPTAAKMSCNPEA